MCVSVQLLIRLAIYSMKLIISPSMISNKYFFIYRFSKPFSGLLSQGLYKRKSHARTLFTASLKRAECFLLQVIAHNMVSKEAWAPHANGLWPVSSLKGAVRPHMSNIFVRCGAACHMTQIPERASTVLLWLASAHLKNKKPNTGTKSDLLEAIICALLCFADACPDQAFFQSLTANWCLPAPR